MSEEKIAGVKKMRPQVMYGVGVLCVVLALVVVLNIINSAHKKKIVEAKPSTSPVVNPWFKDRSIVHVSESVASSPTKMTTISRDESGTVVQPSAQELQKQQQAEEELKASMRAALSSNQITPQTNMAMAQPGAVPATGGVKGDDSGLPKDDQSMTAEKRNFIKSQNALSDSNVLSTTVNKPLAELILAMGTKIPAQLDQEINSDLPGQIYGHVSRDVFDSRTHNNLLIPAGSNLVGSYDSAIAYGQERLLVAWKRVNMPNGQWIDIQGMGAADPFGAGFADQVDNHYWRIFGATFLTSVLAAGAQLSQPQQSNALQAPGTGQVLGASVGTQISQTGTTLLNKNLNIQPTIHIRPGFIFTVEVNKDIVFPSSYTGNLNKK